MVRHSSSVRPDSAAAMPSPGKAPSNTASIARHVELPMKSTTKASANASRRSASAIGPGSPPGGSVANPRSGNRGAHCTSGTLGGSADNPFLGRYGSSGAVLPESPTRSCRPAPQGVPPIPPGSAAPGAGCSSPAHCESTERDPHEEGSGEADCASVDNGGSSGVCSSPAHCDSTEGAVHGDAGVGGSCSSRAEGEDSSDVGCDSVGPCGGCEIGRAHV